MQRCAPINASVKFSPSLALFSGLEQGPAVFNSSTRNIENYPLPIWTGLSPPPGSICLFILKEGQGSEVKRLWICQAPRRWADNCANPPEAHRSCKREGVKQKTLLDGESRTTAD